MKILDAEKKYMFPDVEHMEKWFDEFNGRFFNNELPHIELRVVYGQKRTMGAFHEPKDEHPTGFHPDMCWIYLNGRMFDSEDEWRNTMVHEMVHYYVYMKYGSSVQAHGKEFKAIAKRISASSEFAIQTYTRVSTIRPKPSIIQRWGRNFNDEVILGSYFETAPEDYEDEDTHEVFKIEIRYPDRSFAFHTKRRYIPEIIENMRDVRGEIEWYQVDECCQRLFLIPLTTEVPSYKKEDTIKAFVDEEDLLNEFGPIKWTHLGTTVFREDGVQGYIPGHRKEEFRQLYFRDAMEIGKLAAEMLVKRYVEHPRWYNTTIHGTYNVKPSCGDYTIQVDSRFNPLVAMTPKKILINPVHSDIMMEHIKNGDTDSLAHEIARVIISRQ